MSTADTTRAGREYREAAARLVRLVGSAVPFGSVWYPADTARSLRRHAQGWDGIPHTVLEGLSSADLGRLAPGMNWAELLAFLGDAVEEDGGGVPFLTSRQAAMSPAEARLRYPVMARTRPGDDLPANLRADLVAEIRHAAVLFATDDALRASLGHTVDGIGLAMLDAWSVTPPADHAMSDAQVTEPQRSEPVDGVLAALLALCAEEAERPAPEPLTAVERFLRLDMWGAPLGTMRRPGDTGRQLRLLLSSPEGAYRRLADEVLRAPLARADATERDSLLMAFADETDALEEVPVPDFSELPMSSWEALRRYPKVGEMNYTLEYGDRPTAMANLAEEITQRCYAGCRGDFAAVLAEIAHMRASFGSDDVIRENLSDGFCWLRDVGLLDEAALLVETHLTQRHPAW